MQKQFIKIEKIAIGYKKGSQTKVVCKNLSAEINAGELVCLLGENGTGKSTLIRTLCGFQPLISGTATLLGKNLKTLNERQMAQLAVVVLTDRIKVPNATVEEIVGLGRSPYSGMFGKLNKNDKQLVLQAIEQCGISHKTHNTMANLSDGEYQKVLIAKALAQNTPILILDEPTAFLDLPSRIEIIQLLREIASSSNKAVLLSTHDLDLAMQMADNIWLLSANGTLESGSPEDLLLKNSFQQMFKHREIEFDNRTGLFQVKHKHHTLLQVRGHGFEYVLLRRAFSREGIKITQKEQNNKWMIEIENARFSFFENQKWVFSETSIAAFTKYVIKTIGK